MEKEYFEIENLIGLSNYFSDKEPFKSWIRSGSGIPFINEEYVKGNKLCVIASKPNQDPILSKYFIIMVTDSKGWLKKNYPQLMDFQHDYERNRDNNLILGNWGIPFLEYKEENVGIHWIDRERAFADDKYMYFCLKEIFRMKRKETTEDILWGYEYDKQKKQAGWWDPIDRQLTWQKIIERIRG